MKIKPFYSLLTIGYLCTSLFLTGCIANKEIGHHSRSLFQKYEAKYGWVTLLEDDVIAFGKLSKALPNEPTDSIVVAGNKYSYLINKGGADFIQLISQLNPQYIRINRELDFYSSGLNSNKFSGTFKFSYVPPNGTLSPEERSLFKKYGVAPCDCSKAEQQDNLFSLEISGTVYPKIENATDLKPLSHPYKVRIMYYDNQSGYIKMSRREKLSAIPLLPLTIAIDIIQLPLKALDITYQP
ncbi:YidX family protein [Acinetobacter johnsonii]|uniref:hypothetical protein n=1 Tax=Acinetobacter johnsonii TaxID=40214 RepID=UPI001330D80E|nr:hypothetical protein [Acinetobacter johnsonii]